MPILHLETNGVEFSLDESGIGHGSSLNLGTKERALELIQAMESFFSFSVGSACRISRFTTRSWDYRRVIDHKKMVDAVPFGNWINGDVTENDLGDLFNCVSVALNSERGIYLQHSLYEYSYLIAVGHLDEYIRRLVLALEYAHYFKTGDEIKGNGAKKIWRISTNHFKSLYPKGLEILKKLFDSRAYMSHAKSDYQVYWEEQTSDDSVGASLIIGIAILHNIVLDSVEYRGPRQVHLVGTCHDVEECIHTAN